MIRKKEMEIFRWVSVRVIGVRGDRGKAKRVGDPLRVRPAKRCAR